MARAIRIETDRGVRWVAPPPPPQIRETTIKRGGGSSGGQRFKVLYKKEVDPVTQRVTTRRIEVPLGEYESRKREGYSISPEQAKFISDTVERKKIEAEKKTLTPQKFREQQAKKIFGRMGKDVSFDKFGNIKITDKKSERSQTVRGDKIIADVPISSKFNFPSFQAIVKEQKRKSEKEKIIVEKKRKEVFLKTGGYPAGSKAASEFAAKPLKERKQIIARETIRKAATPRILLESAKDKAIKRQNERGFIERRTDEFINATRNIKQRVQDFKQGKTKRELTGSVIKSFTREVVDYLRSVNKGLGQQMGDFPELAKRKGDALGKIWGTNIAINRLQNKSKGKGLSSKELNKLRMFINIRDKAISDNKKVNNEFKSIIGTKEFRRVVQLESFVLLGGLTSNALALLPKAVTTALIPITAGSLGYGYYIEASKKGIIPTVVNGIFEMGAFSLGAGAGTKIKGKVKVNKITKEQFSNTVNKIKKSKLPKKQKETLLKIFRRGYKESLKPSKSVEKKFIIKELKETKSLIEQGKTLEIFNKSVSRNKKAIEAGLKRVKKEISRRAKKSFSTKINNVKNSIRNLEAEIRTQKVLIKSKPQRLKFKYKQSVEKANLELNKLKSQWEDLKKIGIKKRLFEKVQIKRLRVEKKISKKIEGFSKVKNKITTNIKAIKEDLNKATAKLKSLVKDVNVEFGGVKEIRKSELNKLIFIFKSKVKFAKAKYNRILKNIKQITKSKLTKQGKIDKINEQLNRLINVKKDTSKYGIPRFGYYDRKNVWRSFNKKKDFIKSLRLEAQKVAKIQKIKKIKKSQRLEKKRRILRREQARELRGALPEVVKVKAQFDKKGAFFQLKDPFTGKAIKFRKQKDYLRAVKEFNKGRGDLVKNLRDIVNTKKSLQQYARLMRKKRRVINIKDAPVKKAISKVTQFTKPEQKRTAQIISKNEKVIKAKGGQKQQQLLIQKTQTKKVKKQITKKEVKIKDVEKKIVQDINNKGLNVAKLRTLQILSQSLSVLGLYKTVLNESEKQLSDKVLTRIKLKPDQKIKQKISQKIKQTPAQDNRVAQFPAQKPTQRITPSQDVKDKIAYKALVIPLLAPALIKFNYKFRKGKIINIDDKLIKINWYPRGINRLSKWFTYVSDLHSRFFNIKATQNERSKLLRRGRVFTGTEQRKIV